MQEQANRMSRLIDDLLSLSRLEMRSMSDDAQTFDLAAVASEVIDSMQPVAAESGVEIERRFGKGAFQIRGMRDELVQVIENLGGERLQVWKKRKEGHHRDFQKQDRRRHGHNAVGSRFWARHRAGAFAQIRIVGSSTVYPFTTAVAEAFGKTGSFMKTPVVESTGTGGGIKLFCAGVGEDTRISPTPRAPSRRASSRTAEERRHRHRRAQGRLRRHRARQCQGGPDLVLTKEQIFLALAKEIPGQGRQARRQPLQDVERDRRLAAREKIEVLGPRRPPARATPSSNW
jgi:hypothetical protein